MMGSLSGVSIERYAITGALVVFHLLTLGCSGDAQRTGRVHGEVSIDGAPLAAGQIRFFAVDGGIGSDGVVSNGKYDIPSRDGMSAGKFRVEFSSEKKTGKQIPDRDGDPGDMRDEVIESLPAKFNRNSSVQIEYDPKVDRPYDFKL